MVTGDAKVELFRSVDIFCFPSHYASESFGVVLIEAMSFSLPIVATRWRGIPEVTGEEGTFLVEVRDAAALAARLGELLHSPELRAEMGRMQPAALSGALHDANLSRWDVNGASQKLGAGLRSEKVVSR